MLGKSLLALSLLLSLTAFAEPAAGPIGHSTKGYEELAKKESWSFKWTTKENKYYTGWKSSDAPPQGAKTDKFLKMSGEIPKAFRLSDKTELSPIKNQGACGSCVYFAVSSTFEDALRVRGIVLDPTAPQFLMDCAAPEYRCNGSFFEKVAGGLVQKGGSAREADYPYRARNQACQGAPSLIGTATAFQLIDSSHKSIMTALHEGNPVAATIGAGGPFMNYDSGIFNACQNVATNHQMSIIGYDCESSGQSGTCAFDAQGNLPRGVGNWLVRNSWGTGWGDQGYIRMKITSSNGARCNNVAEEVGIIEVGGAPPPPPPPPPPQPCVTCCPVKVVETHTDGLPLWVYYVGGLISIIGSTWCCTRGMKKA